MPMPTQPTGANDTVLTLAPTDWVEAGVWRAKPILIPVRGSACSLPSAGDCSNIILGVLRSNHKERGKFEDNIIIKKKKKTLGEDEE